MLVKEIDCIYLDVHLQYFATTKLWCIFWTIQVLSYNHVWREWFYTFRVTILFYSIFEVNKTFPILLVDTCVNVDQLAFIDTYVNFLTKMATPNAIYLLNIKQTAAQDLTLTILKDLVLKHNWHRLWKTASDSITVELKSCEKIRESLTYNSHYEVILRAIVLYCRKFIIRLPWH